MKSTLASALARHLVAAGALLTAACAAPSDPDVESAEAAATTTDPVQQLGAVFSGVDAARVANEMAILKQYGKAWNTVGIDNAKQIASHFSDGPIVYRDLLEQAPLTSRQDVETYLRKVYERFPRQVWGKNVRLYPDVFHPGEWAYYYEFELYDAVEAKGPSFTGYGMERVVFDAGGKITSDEIHLIFNEIDSAEVLGFAR